MQIRRIRLKTAHATLLAITLVWLLSGCSLWNVSEAAPTPTPTETPPPTPEPSPTATATMQPTMRTLTIWVPDFLNPYEDSTGAALLLEQLAAFSVIEPDVQIQVIVKDYIPFARQSMWWHPYHKRIYNAFLDLPNLLFKKTPKKVFKGFRALLTVLPRYFIRR